MVLLAPGWPVPREVLQVLMISEDDERMLCTFQPMPPFLQGQFNSKELFAGVVIILCRAEFAREESAWMELFSPIAETTRW